MCTIYVRVRETREAEERRGDGGMEEEDEMNGTQIMREKGRAYFKKYKQNECMTKERIRRR